MSSASQAGMKQVRTSLSEPVEGPCGHMYIMRIHRTCPICAEQAAREAHQKRLAARRRECMPDGLITAMEARQILGYADNWGNGELNGIAIEPQAGGRRVGTLGRKPTLYRRADIERVAVIRTECNLGAQAAIRVFLAQEEKRI